MESKENITLRLARLSQQIDGKHPSDSSTQLISRDALLDSLLALHDECERKLNLDRKSPPKHVAAFVRKGKLLYWTDIFVRSLHYWIVVGSVSFVVNP